MRKNEDVLDDVLRFLICPICEAALHREGGSLRCLNGHVFDIARQGYVSLLVASRRAHSGDTATMVQARSDILATGYFADVADDLAATASEVFAAVSADSCVIDIGAGTGYYLASALDRLPGRLGLALDISKPALRRAARGHDRIGAVACDVWRRLPVVDQAAGVALNIFAPRNGAELRRILDPAGRLLVVTPARDHLSELIPRLGLLTVDERKDERLAEKLSPHFELVERHERRRVITLRHKEVAAVVAMGPSAWHADAAALTESIGRLPGLVQTGLSFTLSNYRPAEH